MPSQHLEAHCSACGAPVSNPADGRAVRCVDCFQTYLRGVDFAFLDNLSRFGIRSRQVVAETCLRALVLADSADRKLLGMAVYEQFVLAASDLIGLHRALRRREQQPVAQSILEFRLDSGAARAFFAELASEGAATMLQVAGVPHPAAIPPMPGMGRKERRELEKALSAAVTGFQQLTTYQELGERALSVAAAHLHGNTALTDRTQWLAGRSISPDQIASIALDDRGGRLDIAALKIDEERLESVANAIDICTRLSRNLIHAFLTVHDPSLFRSGFAEREPVTTQSERRATQ